MNTISIRRGETHLIDVVISATEEALSATLIVKKEVTDLSPIIIKTESFIGDKATIELSSIDTLIPEGDYKYQITIEYSDNSIKKFPEALNCDDDCDFPIIKICNSLDEVVIS